MGQAIRTRQISMSRASVVALTLVIAGCSAMDYTKPITTFADATASAETALVELNKKTTAEYTAVLSQRARTNMRLVVKAADKDCELGSLRCRIVLQSADNSADLTPFPPDPLLENMVAVMGDIRIYAQNLAALVNDDSAVKAQADVNAALGSIQKLANTVAAVDGQGAMAVPSFAAPVGNAINWVVGQYANHTKLDGLKDATRKADPVIQRAAKLFQTTAVVASDPDRAALVASFRTKLDNYSDNRSDEGNLKAAVAAAKTYDALLSSESGAAFQKMGEAHAALADALQRPNLSLTDAIAKIQVFADEAKRLVEIVQDLTAIG